VHLALWRRITETWRDHGWNRQNIAGMLDCFTRGEVPGRNNGHGRDSPLTEPKGWSGLRKVEVADD
jgi:hypothetical protein